MKHDRILTKAKLEELASTVGAGILGFGLGGVDRAISDKIIEQVEKEVFDGMSTGAIFRRVMGLLNEYSPARASCYDLKEAIMRLGPAGYRFIHTHGYWI